MSPGLGRGPHSVEEARRSHPACERRPQGERDRDHREDENRPWRSRQQQPAADAKREPGRRDDAHVGQSVDLILGAGEYITALKWTFGDLPVGHQVNSLQFASTILTNDLSHAYVHENSAYST